MSRTRLRLFCDALHRDQVQRHLPAELQERVALTDSFACPADDQRLLPVSLQREDRHRCLKAEYRSRSACPDTDVECPQLTWTRVTRYRSPTGVGPTRAAGSLNTYRTGRRRCLPTITIMNRALTARDVGSGSSAAALCGNLFPQSFKTIVRLKAFTTPSCVRSVLVLDRPPTDSEQIDRSREGGIRTDDR